MLRVPMPPPHAATAAAPLGNRIFVWLPVGTPDFARLRRALSGQASERSSAKSVPPEPCTTIGAVDVIYINRPDSWIDRTARVGDHPPRSWLIRKARTADPSRLFRWATRVR